jgi:hypothetical protein
MLLDEVFDTVKRIKKVWVRKDGQLSKVDREVVPQPDLPKLPKPMFPIKKPRYADPNA